jgi:hypothetical protein
LHFDVDEGDIIEVLQGSKHVNILFENSSQKPVHVDISQAQDVVSLNKKKE